MAQITQTSQRRRVRLAQWLSGVGWILCACSGGGTFSPSTSGRPEQPQGSSVQVDPSSIVASREGSDWVVNLGITGLTTSRGELALRVELVDGSQVFSEARVSYNIATGESAPLSVHLNLPAASAPEDLATWNLRITSPQDAALNVVRSLLYLAEPQQVRLDGPSSLSAGKRAAYRLTLENPLTRAPIANQPVELQLVPEGATAPAQSLKATTNALGVAEVQVEGPTQGNYTVQAVVPAATTPVELTEPVVVHSASGKVLLTTDKPIYKPGQTIHVRALALKSSENTPLSGADAVIEIEDGKGNKISKKSLKSDAFGVVSTAFTIGSIVNEGTFKIRTSVGDIVSEKTVEVGQYALPKFDVSLQTDKTWYLPGESLQGVVDARYFFGKKVAGGSIDIEASALDIGLNAFAHVMGTTDAEGKYTFSITLPDALVGLPLEQGMALINLKVTAKDTAAQEVVKAQVVQVAPRPLRVSIVPEAGELVSGVDNRLTAFVTDPLGAPIVGATISLSSGAGPNQMLSATTTKEGYATLTLPAGIVATDWIATVTALGKSVNENFSYKVQAGSASVLVRTNKSVYEVGESATIDVLTTDKSGHVFLDLIHDGQQVDVRTLDQKAGQATTTFTLDQALTGSSRVEAYVVDSAGNIIRAGRTIFTRNASNLSIDLATDKPIYAPGEPAQLTFSVKDETGTPTVAALGVQVVDQAVFALVDAQPGLLKSFFEIEGSFATPSYELRAPMGSFDDIFFADKSKAPVEEEAAHQAKAEAVLAALKYAPTGLHLQSWARVVTASNQKLAPFYASEKARLIREVQRLLPQAKAAVERRGCAPQSYYCPNLGISYEQALSQELNREVTWFDFWGNGYVGGTGGSLLDLTTLGPDETKGTGDDHSLSIGLYEVDPSLDAARGGPPTAAPGVPVVDFEGQNAAGATGGSSSAPPMDNGSEPRVRSNFPETLYVNPSVITDASGKATLNVDMADSITEWRVSSMANSANGKLGSAVHGITVFQDFFVDVNFPATLTRGDEVTFPIAVYNYLTTPQTVHLQIEPGDWFTPLAATTLDVALAPGEVKGASFPVRVNKVGLQTLTVKGLGATKSDAAARIVRVIPDGKAFPLAQSGNVDTAITRTVTFSANAVAGSQQLYLNVFPTFLSQAVQGMDSILRMPGGCFEQTTSSAWPNVLVTDYMQKTKQITPDVLIKAESFMSAGYQRLLTFEHPGGGYSWFGTQDQAPFLSVTAFGLMEFSDMSQVHDVDANMVTRTRTWLLGQQQADGSWIGDRSEFFSFHTSALRNTAFVLWALAENGYSGPETVRGLDYVRAQLTPQESDPYTLALIANAAAVLEPTGSLATQVFDKLLTLMKTDASDAAKVNWDSGGTQTNFYGQGQDATVATTALATHALIVSGGHSDIVTKALNYLTGARDPNGNFGSTQATIWTLRTLLLAASKGTESALGTLTVSVDGAPATTVALTAAQSDVMTTVDLGAHATPGQHTVQLSFAGTGKPAYNLVSNENLPFSVIPTPPMGPLSVAVGYDRAQLAVNDTVKATVTVTNNTPNLQNMALVTVGLPPGFELQTEDLKPYLDQKSLSKYEITGKQVLFYIPELGKQSQLLLSYRLKATMPVKASDGGASVYPYYQPDQKVEIAGTTLEAVQN